MKKRWFSVAIAAIALLWIQGASVAQSGRSFIHRINADRNAGILTVADAQIIKALAVKIPKVLPPAYQPGVLDKCTSHVVMDLLHELPSAHPKVQRFIHFLFAAPKVQQNLTAPDLNTVSLRRADLITAGVNILTAARPGEVEYLTPGGHFVVHYSTSGTHATTASYAQQVGQVFEQSWTHEIGTLGYNQPSLGSDNRMDIYIRNLGTSLYGVAHPEGLFSEAYIEINRDFSWAGSSVGALQATAAHEFFHQIQFAHLSGLTSLGESWWMESSATFMEDEVFDSANDYLNYLSGFYNSTHVSLPDIGGGYQTVLINKFLKEKINGGNPGIIKEVLDTMGLLTSAEEAIASVLASHGSSMAEGFQHFALWNFLTGSRTQSGYYEEASSYPLFQNFQNTHEVGPNTPSTDLQTATVDDLAAGYYTIKPAADMIKPGILSVQIERPDDQIRGWVVVERSSGSPEIKELSFDLKGKAREKVADFKVGSVKQVVLILSNGEDGLFGLSDTVKYTASLGTDVVFVIDTTGSMWDDIASVQAAAREIVNKLAEETDDFRFAVVDFKDFPSYPYGDPGDYPYRARLSFSDDAAAIIAAINSLSASGGADWPESVYSGLMGAINAQGLGSWREGAKKSIILMGDAPPHDPEPFTGYTLASVTAAAKAGGITLGSERLASFAAPIAAPTTPISIYSIVIGGDFSARSYFETLATQTGGQLFTAPRASDVVAALLEAIGDIGSPTNRPPDVTWAAPNIAKLWPVNHKMVNVSITNVTDPDGDPVTITITGITQDEPVQGEGSGNTSPDGAGVGTGMASVRAERAGNSNSRVYRITFVARDGRGGETTGQVFVSVPHDASPNTIPLDDGQVYDSTRP